MKFVTYLENETEVVGIVVESQIVKVNDVLDLQGLAPVDSLLDLIAQDSKGFGIMAALQAADLTALPHFNFDRKNLLAPIPYPKRNIFCLGKNYLEHADEIKGKDIPGTGIPKAPVYFTKTAMPAIGNAEFIRFSKSATRMVDYEAELAVIIGRKGQDIRPEDAEQYIFGYTIINDVSARDLQIKHEQWFKGKSLDTFCPMGPYIVDKSELPFPIERDISCTVNGEVRQDSNTRELIFSLPVILSDLSKGLTLMPGDIICTGTPSGVGAGFDPYRFLEDGDLVECSIEGIGTLSNRVRIED